MTQLTAWLLIAVLVSVWGLAGAWAFDIANHKGYPEWTRLAGILGPLALIYLRSIPDAVPCEPDTVHDWEKTGRLTRRCKICGHDRQLKEFR